MYSDAAKLRTTVRRRQSPALLPALSHNAHLPRNASGFVHKSQGDPMPTIRVDLMEGRTVDQKRALVKAITQAVVDTLGARPESVDVLLFDVKRHDWATGGELWSDKRPG
ncbi:4-oxalocrotonate tautomerase [Ramlibacter lithotrophicus]